MLIVLLFVIAFFLHPQKSDFNNHLLAIKTVFVQEDVEKRTPDTQEATAIASQNNSQATKQISKKTHSAELANLALLNPTHSFAAAPLAAKTDEATEEFFGYLDVLPSVQGIAFYEGMTPATQNLSERSETYIYTVEEHDTPGGIADLFGISLDTLLWANNLTPRSIIKPGDTLTILPVNGVAHTVSKGETLGNVAKKYSVIEDDIIGYNNLIKDAPLAVGTTLVIPNGVKPAAPIVTLPRVVSNQTINAPTGWLIQPAAGRNWGRRHGFNGVDIANSCGTPLVAAAPGTVIISDDVGWNGGYGKYIKIQHPNGVITLYAHAKELYVDAGVQVIQGQTIALMGTTGRSTGCHVHFEVRGAKNPFVRR